MFKEMWSFILNSLGVTKKGEKELKKNVEFSKAYEETRKVNFTAIFSNKLTTLAMAESTAIIYGDSKRAEFLEGCLDEVWFKLRRICSRMLGTGGSIVIPYVKNRKIYFDILSQDRLIIHDTQGDKITKATILADSIEKNEKLYFRWVDYKVDNGNLYITNRITDENGAESGVSEWEGFKDFVISNMDRVLFSFFKSPIDNRKFDDDYGVPITYGSQGIIEEIYEVFEQIRDEFSMKEVKIFADDRMFQKDVRTGKFRIPSKMFFATHGNEKDSLIEVFSPEIRHSSYYERLQQLFALLEKSVGTNKGILTAPETRGATATEIKAGLFDTYALVCEVREVLERGVRDYIGLCEVLASVYDLASQGKYDLGFDWSYAMVESSSEAWGQLKDGLELGIKSKAELRQWLTPNESIGEAEEFVKSIGGDV